MTYSHATGLHGSGNAMRDAEARGEADDATALNLADLEADRLLDEVDQKGRASDLIVSLLEDEVTAALLTDLALDIVLSERSGHSANAADAMTALSRFLVAQAVRLAEAQS